MRLRRLLARHYRNLADLDCEIPPGGLVLLGDNAQGKTNLLEAIYYPVLFRSFRGAPDAQVAGDKHGFHVEVQIEGVDATRIAATYRGRRKQIAIDGVPAERVSDVAGIWLGVAFLPSDVGLASGPASERRLYLDRMLSLSNRQYLKALSRYRGALVQRNSALRKEQPGLAQAFDGPLADSGAELVRTRRDWVRNAAEQFAAEFECLGEPVRSGLEYRGDTALAEVEAWAPALKESLPNDQVRGMTTIGPHRHDLRLTIAGRLLREFGSTGQQRSAAVALKLIEIATLRKARAVEPALLLDDVFAELDRERQGRLAGRLVEGDERQVFVSSPRRDELPPNLDLPVWQIKGGRVTRGDFALSTDR